MDSAARVAALGGTAIVLIRHAQTAFNAEKRFCGGSSNPALDEAGRLQARALTRFVVERVYSSPLLRALETARVLGEPEVIEGLREIDQGELEGRDISTTLPLHPEFFRAWRADPTNVAVPGGESLGQVAERMSSVMNTLAPAHRGMVVGVVGHQMAQAAFVCRALGEPLARWHRFELGNARAHILAWDGRSWSLLARDQ